MITIALIISVIVNVLLGILFWIHNEILKDMKEEIQHLLEERQYDISIPEEDIFRRVF